MRREMSKLLKELKVPTKLYRGSKFSFYRHQSYLRFKLERLQLSRPGTLVHDCDGFNHIVKGLCVYTYYRNGSSKTTNKRGFNSFQNEFGDKKGYVFVFPQVEFEDGGRLSCGCESTPEPPLGRDFIEKRVLRWYLNPDPGWPLGEVQIKRRDALLSGKHITDERGVLLEEYW